MPSDTPAGYQLREFAVLDEVIVFDRERPGSIGCAAIDNGTQPPKYNNLTPVHCAHDRLAEGVLKRCLCRC